ncbi:MAG: hypothetical protein ABJC79_00085, partial [Acidimicrobiia bacterium]
ADRPGPEKLCDAVVNHELLLQPGLHWDSALLDRIGDGHCGDVTIRLAVGGPHIFDFQFYDGTGRPDWKLVPAARGATVRVVNDGFDTGCTGTASPVLFAGKFTMQLGAGATADLCGPDGSGQHIAAAQVVAGADPAMEHSAVTTPTSWTVDQSRDASFNFPPSSIATPADLLAAPDCDPNRSCTSGFVPGTLRGDRAVGTVVMTIPDPVSLRPEPDRGLLVDSLHLDITHREPGGDVAEAHVWISDGLPDKFVCDLSDPGHRLSPSNDFQTDGYECDLTGVGRPYFPTPTGDLQVTYQVQLKNQANGKDAPARSADIALDSVRLSAQFARPTARTSAPSGDILTTKDGGAMHALGTVYLPSGDVKLNFNGENKTRFERGLVVNSVDVSRLPSQADFTPFSLPGGGNYTDRLTTFQAFLGSDTTAPPLLTTRVRFCDVHPEGGAPTLPCAGALGGPAKILAWDPTR